MDPSRFDALTRSLTASSFSRRGAVAGFAALVAPLVAHLDAEAKRHRRRGHGHPSIDEQDRARGHAVDAEKKKKKKKKKPSPTPCGPTCAGKSCGSDGCSGSCGSCASGKSCTGGACVPDSGACSPACTGGQVCEPDDVCRCPADKPFFYAGFCGECYTDTDCGNGSSFNHYQCRYDLGRVCRCWDNEVDCGEGRCVTCCTREDCMINLNFDDASVICTAPGNPNHAAHLCVCPEGKSVCLADQRNYCADLRIDPYNCGFCGNVCTQGRQCINKECLLPS